MIVSSKILKEINKIFNEHIKYSKLSTAEKNTLIKAINANTTHLSPIQIIDMHNTFIYLLSKTKGTLAHRLGDDIMNEYKNKTTIIDIAKKYELPPMSIIYQILIESKHESHNIDKIIIKKTLPKDIQVQMPDIVKCDPRFWFPCNIPNICNKLNKLNCSFKLKYNSKQEGKCPDIIFNETCTYKRKSFNWIVFRPYILFDSDLHIHDIQKIINNFNRFGTGLILYNDIICSNSFIKKINVNVCVYEFLD